MVSWEENNAVMFCGMKWKSSLCWQENRNYSFKKYDGSLKEVAA